MSSENYQLIKNEYTNEGLVQQLALLKIQTEIHSLKAHEIGNKFKDYCDQIRAHL